MAIVSSGEFTAVEQAAAVVLAQTQKMAAGIADPAAVATAAAALRRALPDQLVAQADHDVAVALADGTSRGQQISAEQTADHMRRLGLDPAQWDLAEVQRKANAWIANQLVELAAGADPRWSAQQRREHHAEFGALSAVDFVEQCVIEAGPDHAPWRDLHDRLTAGEFNRAAPVWAAPALGVNPAQTVTIPNE